MMTFCMVDIIIVNFNSTDHTIQCIKSIHQLSGLKNCKIVVIDNCSKDHPQRLKSIFPGVSLIMNKKNIGFGQAVNVAVRKTDGEYILLINPDSMILNDQLPRILQYIQKNPKIAIVGPKIRDYSGRIQGSARKFPTLLTSILGRKSPITRLIPNNPVIRDQFPCFYMNNKKPIKVDWVSGACMLIRRSAFEEVGGFDAKFYLYWEDADLCRRLKHHGWEIAYHPAAEVMHHVGKSSDTKLVFSILQFHKSSYLLYIKDYKCTTSFIAPFVLIGLILRCIYVIGLNLIQRRLHSRNVHYPADKKINYRHQTKSKKVKILRIVSRLNIGGPSIHCSILIKKLDQNHFVSKLVSGSISPHEGSMSYLIENGDDGFVLIPELQREINIRKDFLAFVKITKLIYDEKPVIVHSHLAKAGALSRAAVFLYNAVSRHQIKTVHTFHGHILDGYFGPIKSRIFLTIEKALAKRTDAIIAISQTQKWELTERYKLTVPEKVHIINLGFDLSKFINPVQKGLLRNHLKIGDNTLIIGIVGRLVPIKNHRLFLDAAKIVKSVKCVTPLKFAIIGDGELRKGLEDYAAEIGLGNDVCFCGWIKDIEHVYADLDILALTSNNEGTPVSII
jgi:GT2 family glycosyltransferase/glycosyltransferase involved in cell wall biosynthesis